MFVVSNLLAALAQITDIALNILFWLIFIRALISWVSPDPYNPIVQFLYKTTEPLLYPIRRALPASLRFGLDISPLIAALLIFFARAFLVRTLFELSLRMR